MNRVFRFTTVFPLLTASVFAQENTLPSPKEQANQKEQQEVTAVFNQFLDAWLVKQDIDKAVKFFDRHSLMLSTRNTFPQLRDEKFNYDVWLRKVLLAYLRKDHGEVQVLGHGDPTKPGYSQLPVRSKQLPSRMEWGNAYDAVTGFELVPQSPGVCWVSLGLKHVSHEGIIIAFEKIKGTWKATAFYWLAG